MLARVCWGMMRRSEIRSLWGCAPATPFRAHRLFDETPVEQGGWDSGSPWFFPLFFLSRQILLQLLGCFLLARFGCDGRLLMLVRYRLTRVLPFCDGVFLVSYSVLRAMLIHCLIVIQMTMLIVYSYYCFAV